MNEIMIQELINCALDQLCGLNLCGATINSYQGRAFKPISDFYQKKVRTIIVRNFCNSKST